ncbi:hypothetical protein GCM10009557_68160 [Virgisporangium ochraceum]
MGGAVIELGLAEPWEDEPPPPRRWPPRLPRWLLPAVVTAATLLTLGAAAAPKRWDPVLSQRDPNTALRFASDDTAFLTTQRIRSGRLQAFRPGRSAPLWTVNFPNGFPSPYLVGDPGLVTVSVFDSDPDGQGARDAVQVRYTRTGRLLRHRTGRDELAVMVDTTVVVDRGSDRVAPAGATVGTPAQTIEAVDRRTGETRWSRVVDAATVVRTREASDGRPDAVVELATDGRLRISDPSTGDPIREHRLALTGTPLNVEVKGGLAIVFQQRSELDDLTVAYDLATGVERWRHNSRFSTFCGDRYLCTATPEQMMVADLAAGEIRYRGRGDRFLVRGDRLVVSWPAVRPRSGATEVRDLRTGRRLHTYPGWAYAGSDRTGTLLSQETSGGGLMLAALDVATGRFSVIGRDTRWTGTATCVRGVRYVGCTGLNGVRIWPLPR